MERSKSIATAAVARPATAVKDDLTHGFVLGERIVEPRLGVVVTEHDVRHLAPKAMSVLLLLAEHQGDLLSRSVIVERLWNGSNITHATLSRHVCEIRRCLDDDAKHPRFVETVPKLGYRLICTVDAEDNFGNEILRLDVRQPEDDVAPVPGPVRLNGFFNELCQRKVVKAALLYVLMAWLSLQTGEILFPALGVPEWALTFLVLLGVLGFPIALVLAWAFDITPGGLILDVSVNNQRTASKGRFASLNVLVVVTLMIVVLILAGMLIMQARATVT